MIVLITSHENFSLITITHLSFWKQNYLILFFKIRFLFSFLQPNFCAALLWKEATSLKQTLYKIRSLILCCCLVGNYNITRDCLWIKTMFFASDIGKMFFCLIPGWTWFFLFAHPTQWKHLMYSITQGFLRKKHVTSQQECCLTERFMIMETENCNINAVIYNPIRVRASSHDICTTRLYHGCIKRPGYSTAAQPCFPFFQWPRTVLQQKIPLQPKKHFHHKPPL